MQGFIIDLERPQTESHLAVVYNTKSQEKAVNKAKKEFPGWIITNVITHEPYVAE